MTTRKLYYIDGGNIREVPYTEDRAAAVTPIFYETRLQALNWLKANLLGKAYLIDMRIEEIEAEINEI